jgi:hypothetical protein
MRRCCWGTSIFYTAPAIGKRRVIAAAGFEAFEGCATPAGDGAPADVAPGHAAGATPQPQRAQRVTARLTDCSGPPAALRYAAQETPATQALPIASAADGAIRGNRRRNLGQGNLGGRLARALPLCGEARGERRIPRPHIYSQVGPALPPRNDRPRGSRALPPKEKV